MRDNLHERQAFILFQIIFRKISFHDFFLSLPNSGGLRLGVYRDEKEVSGNVSTRSDDSDEDGPILYREEDEDEVEDEGSFKSVSLVKDEK